MELSKAPAGSDRTKAPGRSSTALAVTIAGDHASRSLVTDQLVLNVTGTYTVRDSLFGAGSPLTPTGGGTFNVGLWQLGLQSVMDSAKARISVLQPAGRGRIGSAAVWNVPQESWTAGWCSTPAPEPFKVPSDMRALSCRYRMGANSAPRKCFLPGSLAVSRSKGRAADCAWRAGGNTAPAESLSATAAH